MGNGQWAMGNGQLAIGNGKKQNAMSNEQSRKLLNPNLSIEKQVVAFNTLSCFFLRLLIHRIVYSCRGSKLKWRIHFRFQNDFPPQ